MLFYSIFKHYVTVVKQNNHTEAGNNDKKSGTDRVDEGEAQQEQSEPVRKGHGRISSSGGLKPPEQQLSAHLTAILSRKHVG